MARRPYRIELVYPRKNRPTYYLVRDVKLGTKRRKVRKYLGHDQPSAEELERVRREFAPEMELRAARKKAEMSCEAYKSELLSGDSIRHLEEVRWIYNGVLNLLTAGEIREYEREFEISYVQGTTAIEGNTLTHREAADLLERGVAPQGKPLREINEVQNFRKVARFRNGYKGKVTVNFIRRLHALVMANIDDDAAGALRRIDGVSISGCDLRLTPSVEIENELKEIIRSYYGSVRKGQSPFEAAVLFHYRFELIHPFTDGNGRVGREVLNYMLAREKYPKLLFLGKERDRYINALRKGNVDKYGEMVSIFAEIVIGQRMKILLERLQSLSKPRKVGQASLRDFVST